MSGSLPIEPGMRPQADPAENIRTLLRAYWPAVETAPETQLVLTELVFATVTRPELLFCHVSDLVGRGEGAGIHSGAVCRPRRRLGDFPWSVAPTG